MYLQGKEYSSIKKTAVCLILRGLQLTILVFFVGRVEGSEFGTWPSVAIPKPRFVFWGDGNQMLLKSTFTYLVCKVHLLVAALLLRQWLVWNMAASRP